MYAERFKLLNEHLFVKVLREDQSVWIRTNRNANVAERHAAHSPAAQPKIRGFELDPSFNRDSVDIRVGDKTQDFAHGRLGLVRLFRANPFCR